MTATIDSLCKPLTIETAPEAARPAMETIQKSLGFIPNLMATFANCPVVLEGYLALDVIFEKGSFTPKERQIILLAASIENNCGYCAAARFTIAKGVLHASPEVIAAIRKGLPVLDAKLHTLVTLVKELIRERGHGGRRNNSEVPRPRLQEGTGDGAPAGHCPEDHQQLSRSYFADSCRSGFCSRKQVTGESNYPIPFWGEVKFVNSIIRFLA